WRAGALRLARRHGVSRCTSERCARGEVRGSRLMAAAATLLACISGVLIALALASFLEIAAPALALRLSPVGVRGSEWIRRTLRPFRLASTEGLVPTDLERLRLQAVVAVVVLVFALSILGAVAGVVLSIASAWLAGRSLVWRRARYRRRLD